MNRLTHSVYWRSKLRGIRPAEIKFLKHTGARDQVWAEIAQAIESRAEKMAKELENQSES
jgi:hypothetical protein